MLRPLVAFSGGGVIWSTFASMHGPAEYLSPWLFMLAMSPRWEVHATSASGDRLLTQVEGVPLCASELDARGVICVAQSPNGSHLWRAASVHSFQRVADLLPSFDIVHAGSRHAALAERFGARAAIVDVETRQAVRLTLPDSGRGRWTTDVLASGDYLFTLSAGRDGATLQRFTIR
jgi:hypothetical protein